MEMKQCALQFLVICFLFLARVAPAFAVENWPMFNHDPQLSGRTGTFVTGTLTKKWEKKLASPSNLRSQPIVVDGVVYVATIDGILRGISLQNGSEKWVVQTGGLILGSPAESAGKVVVGVSYGDHGEVRAYDTNGQQKWTVSTLDPISASPIMYRGMVIVGAHDGVVYAIDIEGGKTLWKSSVGGRIIGAAAADKGTIVVAADDMKGYAFSTDGTLLWTTSLPGETIRDTHPLIAADTVLFTTTSRANEYEALEDQPHRGERPLDPGNPNFSPPETVLPANERVYEQNPAARSTVAVDLRTGVEKFKVSLSTPYWGALNPVMLSKEVALKHALYSSFGINMRTGNISFLGGSDSLFRYDEYAYSSVGGGQKEYGAIADDLGMYDFTQKKKKTLVGAFWSHAVPEWVHPPDDSSKKMYVPGPGDGNSGYATTPVLYDNFVIWQNSGNWLMVHQGVGGNEVVDNQPPSAPTALTVTAKDGRSTLIRWQAATDTIGVYGYKVYRDGVFIAETDATSYVDVDIDSSKSYVYGISAIDQLNNESMQVKTSSTSSGTAPTVCIGDINRDRSVNLSDHMIFLRNFLRDPPSDLGADLSADGKVNLSDYLIFSGHFLRPC